MAKNIIDINLPPEKYVISLNNKHFERNYSIYILEIIHNNLKYYYIEKLNDNLNISNKIPFIKLYQQFEDISSSRNNKVYKYILNNIIEKGKNPDRKITEKLKAKVDEFLSTAEVNMHIYPLIKFDFSGTSKKQHKENSYKVNVFEKQVIRLFSRADKIVMNDTIEDDYVRYDEILFPKIWEQIKIDFYV